MLFSDPKNISKITFPPIFSYFTIHCSSDWHKIKSLFYAVSSLRSGVHVVHHAEKAFESVKYNAKFFWNFPKLWLFYQIMSVLDQNLLWLKFVFRDFAKRAWTVNFYHQSQRLYDGRSTMCKKMIKVRAESNTFSCQAKAPLGTTFTLWSYL